MTPEEILRENRRQAQIAAQQVGVGKLRVMLERAQRDLNAALIRAEGLRGPGADSFTATRARAVLGQVRDVLRALGPNLRTLIVEQAVRATDPAVQETMRFLEDAERRFAGLAQPLGLHRASVLDEIREGTEASALRRIANDPNHPGRPGVLARYGESVIGKFEEELQQRALTGKSWGDVRDQLIADSPFLQGSPMFWAERIVRTETLAAGNRAAQETLVAADKEMGDMLKILCATFDARTGADSYAVHGQIRRVSEAFDDWTHSYMHPPNRPNDRETVVPHRVGWPIPPTLKPKSDAEVASRWTAEGRKGSPPPRPRMSTVDLGAMQADHQAKQAAPPPAPKPPRVPKPPAQPKAKTWTPPALVKPNVTVRTLPDGTVEAREQDGTTAPIPSTARALFDSIAALANSAGKIRLDALAPGLTVDDKPAYLDPLKKLLKTDDKIHEAKAMRGLRRSDLDRVVFPSAELDADIAKGFAARPWHLHLRKPLLVRYCDKIHVHDGAELLLAQKLEGTGGPDLDVDIVDLDLIDPPKAASKAQLSTDMAAAINTAVRGGDGSSVRDRMREIMASAKIPTRDGKRSYHLFPDATAARKSREFRVSQGAFPIAGAEGVHMWTDEIEVTRDVASRATAALSMDRAAFLAAPQGVRNARADGLRVLVHEELHGASLVRPAGYQGVGIGIEEAGTEILARKLTREHLEDPTVSKLPSRQPDGSYIGGYGAYASFIKALLKAVDEAYGDGTDVGARIEEAFVKTRQWTPGENTQAGYFDPRHQIEAFVNALPGLSPAKRLRLRRTLNDPNGPLAGP